MRGPNLRKLIRSLRTKSYEKLSLRKYLDALPARPASPASGVPREQEPDLGSKPHREVEPGQNHVLDPGGQAAGKSNPVG